MAGRLFPAMLLLLAAFAVHPAAAQAQVKGEVTAVVENGYARLVFHLADDVDSQVRVDLPGGTASVTWEGPGHPLWLTGPATMVYTGSIDI